MNNHNNTLMELHDMLKTIEASLLKEKGSNPTAPILDIGHGGANKKKNFSHFQGKTKVGPSYQCLKRKLNSEITPNTNPKEAICF